MPAQSEELVVVVSVCCVALVVVLLFPLSVGELAVTFDEGVVEELLV